ncbi:Rho-binding antiterminator [Nitrosomonas communis]|uniref:Rho-binding antiterminator n=1 Tax=Nitrosomonas communis TaxID=44574 RepID=UPI0026F2BA7E|nr:Rho-binding antiterminator [Nitrosomonas communis]MCO6426634.1 Rho-binding antiterminator [Nitrosomonas communis]
MTQQLIECELHDYIEVACMYGYQLRLILKDRQVFAGKAKDIVTTADKREFLVIENEQGSQQIELIQLEKMQVLTANAQFSEVVF